MRGRRLAHALTAADPIDALLVAVAIPCGVVGSLRLDSAVAPVLVLIALAGLCVAASIDRRTLRLPNTLTGTGFALGLAVGAVSGTIGGALVGAALVAAPFLVVHLADPDGMGFGDVKCAAAVGAVAGAVVPTVGPLLAVVAVLVGVVVLRLVRRSDGPRALGPAIVLGAAVAIAAGAAIVPDPDRPPARDASIQEIT